MRALGFLLVIGTLGSAAAAALSSDGDLSEQVTELNSSALAQIDRKKFDAARKFLREAERIARGRGGVLGDGWLARTQLHLGALEIVAGGDPAQAKEQFRRALCRVPSIRIGGPIGTRVDVVRAFEDVRIAFRPPPRCPAAPREGEPEPELPAYVHGLDCSVPDEVLAGTDVVLRCAAHPKLRVEAVTLQYDLRGGHDYQVVAMRQSARGWWTAVLPGREISGNSFAYFFQGLNVRAHHVISNGSREGPNVTLVISPQLCRCD